MRRRTTFDEPRRQGAPQAVRLVLTAMKSAALGGLFALLVVGGLAASRDDAAPATSSASGAVDGTDRIVEEAMTSQQCSLQGFAESTVPASALIRTPRGAVKVVSFQHGWDVYQGRRPGSLIAVCLRERPGR